MLIKIETPYGKNTFNLPSEQVNELIRQATKYVTSNNKPRTTESILIGEGYICKKQKNGEKKKYPCWLWEVTSRKEEMKLDEEKKEKK